MLLTSPKGNFDLYGALNHLLTVNKMEIKNKKNPKKEHTYNFNINLYNLTFYENSATFHINQDKRMSCGVQSPSLKQSESNSKEAGYIHSLGCWLEQITAVS